MHHILMINSDFITAPPPPSADEIRAQETLARATIIGFVGMCSILYVCEYYSLNSVVVPSLT
jgi:hypothetical protein